MTIPPLSDRVYEHAERAITLHLTSAPPFPAFVPVVIPDLQTRSVTLLTLPDSQIRGGSYSLHPYAPTESMNFLAKVYGVYALGTRPKRARTKQEVEDVYPMGYVFTSSIPVQTSPSSILYVVQQRANSLKLEALDAKTLTSQGIDAQLHFRSPHFTIHHAPNTFTLICSMDLPERLRNILTSV